MTTLIRGMHGLGDNFHQRPFVRAMALQEETYLSTPWPQVYEDLRQSVGLKLLPATTLLRTQHKNVMRGYTWDKLPLEVDARIVDLHYGSNTMLKGSLHDEIERLLPLNGKPWDNTPPPVGDCPVQADKPIALVRPVTVRKEWCSIARNPDPQYIAHAAKKLQAIGYHVVTVADVDGRKEMLEGPTPVADSAFLKGELFVEQLMALVASAAIMVTPVGWSLHMGIAYRTPTICIAGGRGQHCAPWKETDPRQELAQLKWMMPDVYCMCDTPDHGCGKRISSFERRFDRLLATMPIRLPGTMLAPATQQMGLPGLASGTFGAAGGQPCGAAALA